MTLSSSLPPVLICAILPEMQILTLQTQTWASNCDSSLINPAHVFEPECWKTAAEAAGNLALSLVPAVIGQCVISEISVGWKSQKWLWLQLLGRARWQIWEEVDFTTCFQLLVDFYQCFPAGEKRSCCSHLRHQPSHFWPDSVLLLDRSGGTKCGLEDTWDLLFHLPLCSGCQCLLHGLRRPGKVSICLSSMCVAPSVSEHYISL